MVPSSYSTDRLFPRRAFTIIEMLAVVATTGILAVLAVGATQKALDSANKVREIQAGRQLVRALLASAEDNNGTLLPGMDYRAGKADTPVYNLDGTLVPGHAAQRYPFRLRPYLDNTFEGTIFANRNKKEIIKKTGGKGPMYDYQISAYPALGMNIYCVGGVVRGDGTYVSGADCIARSANLRGSILAFASAGSGTGASRTHGFSYVTPPTVVNDSPLSPAWQSAASWSRDKDPMDYGWIDYRYDDKAVCAFLDGSVRMCGVEELSDMRRWTSSAQDADDPNYLLTLTP